MNAVKSAPNPIHVRSLIVGERTPHLCLTAYGLALAEVLEGRPIAFYDPYDGTLNEHGYGRPVRASSFAEPPREIAHAQAMGRIVATRGDKVMVWIDRLGFGGRTVEMWPRSTVRDFLREHRALECPPGTEPNFAIAVQVGEDLIFRFSTRA